MVKRTRPASRRRHVSVSRSYVRRRGVKESTSRKVVWVKVSDFLDEFKPLMSVTRSPKGVCSEFAQKANADIISLLAVMRVKKSGNMQHAFKGVCVPRTVLHIHMKRSKQPRWIISFDTVQPFGKTGPTERGFSRVMSIRAGIIACNLSSLPQSTLHLPPGMDGLITSCRAEKSLRYLVWNFGVYQGERLDMGHANALVFDIERSVIERFEPAGLHSLAGGEDTTIEILFRHLMPEWNYIGTRRAGIERGVQSRADTRHGLCVAYSFAYVLLRVLNPRRSLRDISVHMSSGSRVHILQWACELNRFISGILKDA